MIELRWYYPEHRHLVSDVFGNATASSGEAVLQWRTGVWVPDAEVLWGSWKDVPEVFAHANP
jgi:hypothetical protein